MSNATPLVLMILDGWGYNEQQDFNAIKAAKTPQWDAWWQSYPHTLLDASGQAVGLPDGQMGNSEVGHMHIGAGRIIPQDFTRINQAIERGDFANNVVLTQAIEDVKHQNKAMHVLGLLSPGGVHSHEHHLFAFLKLCAKQALTHVYLHLFLDGRDTPPRSALDSLKKLNAHLTQYQVGRVCSISGRFYAMDRDKRWERIEPVYQLLTEGKSEYSYESAEQALEAFYHQDINDEFIPPTRIGETCPIEDGDAVFFFNFRADRARELTESFVLPDFNAFLRRQKPKLSHFITMTRYAKSLPTEMAYPPFKLENTLGEVISKAGLSQLRIAETEKYAHVTFFLNGGREDCYEQEKRHLIPSPKVKTYDLQPEMSAKLITQHIIDAIEQKTHDVIICNYANADMVGHTGQFHATVAAIECLDHCMKRIGEALKKAHGQMLITADHGNAELMYDSNTRQAHTAHTKNLVPLLYIGDGWHFNSSKGRLIDIAPTVLQLLNLSIPHEMTGQALLEANHE